MTLVLRFLLLVALFSRTSALDGEYLYNGDPEADNLILEYQGNGQVGDFLASNKPRITEFYSPYCGHCQRFKPLYLRLASTIMADFPNIEFYAVSCAAQKDMCKQYEVTSYPTFYIFNDENPRGKLFNKGAGGVTEEAIIAALAKAKQDTAEERGLAAKEDDSADDDDDSQDGMLEHKEDDDPVMDDDEQAAKQGGNGATNTNGGAETAAKNELPPAVVRTSERDGAANDSKGDSDEDDDDDYGGRVKQSRFESPQLSSSKEMDVRQARIQRLRERVAARREALKGQVSPGQSGALSAKYERHDMDRFKDQVREEREKPRNRLRTERGPSRGREMEPIAEGATKTMRENVPGTKEHEQRKQEILDSIRRTKGQSRAKQVEEKLATPPPPDGKASLPFKKEVSKPRLVERVPVMKRLATLGSEEELILDTTLSFLQGLKIGVFRTNQALKDHEKNALEDWLYLLRVTLPQEWSIHEVIDDLLDNFDSIVQSDENLARILAKHPFPRSAWSESCGQGKVGGGFTCGMWKLIHTMTVGLAEYRGGMNVIKAGMARSDSSYFSPEEAGDVLREYVANFLPCTDCAKHFTEKYDDCSYRRCHRLHDNAETASDADWKELAKYMWEFHNEVSIRILHEQADAARKQISGEIGPGAASRADEIRVIFPSLAQCVTCFKSDGSWNEDALFLFLERTYWPSGIMDKKTARLLKFEDDVDAEFSFTLFLVLLGLAMIIYMRESLFSKSGLQQTMVMARAMRPKLSGAEKRSV